MMKKLGSAVGMVLLLSFAVGCIAPEDELTDDAWDEMLEEGDLDEALGEGGTYRNGFMKNGVPCLPSDHYASACKLAEAAAYSGASGADACGAYDPNGDQRSWSPTATSQTTTIVSYYKRKLVMPRSGTSYYACDFSWSGGSGWTPKWVHADF